MALRMTFGYHNETWNIPKTLSRNITIGNGTYPQPMPCALNELDDTLPDSDTYGCQETANSSVGRYVTGHKAHLHKGHTVHLRIDLSSQLPVD